MAEKLKFEVVSNSVELPEVKEIRDGRRDYVTYGDDNLFPQYIFDLFLHSALFESIIKGTCDYAIGNDLVTSTSIEEFARKVNKDNQTLYDIVEKAIFDYLLFDGFYIQVFRDSDGKINELYNLDFQCCRISRDGKRVVYCPEWEKYNAQQKSYPIFSTEKDLKNSIFYFKGKTAPQAKTYPIPTYIGALSDIRTSVEISNFHLNSIVNDFNSSCIINLNSGEVDDDTKKKVEKKFKDKFAGTNNAGKFVLNFNENKDTAITIERLQSDDFDKRYEALSKSVTEKIFTAFRAIPCLFGLRSEGSMFNHEEYNDAFKLYQRTVIIPIQHTIERVFDKIFGIEDSIKIIPFKLEEETSNE